MRTVFTAAAVAIAAAALAAPGWAADTPKRGGTLTYMIPADAPPSFDGHRETTFATAHSVAPFYSVLVRVNPQNPSSTTDFRPHRFVDITHFIEQKIALIGAYKSQIDRMESIQPDVIVSTARYWGRFAGYVLAEPLRIVRQRDSEPALEVAEEQEQRQSQPVSLAKSGD